MKYSTVVVLCTLDWNTVSICLVRSQIGFKKSLISPEIGYGFLSLMKISSSYPLLPREVNANALLYLYICRDSLLVAILNEVQQPLVLTLPYLPT